ncbi:MATE family efflux transporter [bacterium]|nr:MATE family efflux transporter [bacterium]
MNSKPITQYAKELLNIAAPIIMGNIGFILIGVGDIIVAGRHSTDTFAAISIAAAIVNCIMTIAIGLTSSISPLLSNYRGQNKPIKRYFYPSIRFAGILAIVTGFIIAAFVPFIPKLGFEEHLIKPIQQYMLISALSTFGGSLHHSMKEFLQAFEIVLFPNLLTIFSVFLNLLLNIIFVFGWGVIPSMGAAGLAIASLIVRYFMGFALLIYCRTIMRVNNYHEKGYYVSLVKIGLPIALAILVEFFAFNIIAILMGRVAGVYAAAQNLICTITTISFMIPFAISNAIAVKVGFSNGAENYVDLKRFAYTGTLMSEIFMAFSAIMVLLFPKFIIGIFTKDPELIKIALPVMLVLVIFQLFDGLQISLSGICKGIKQTKIILLANFIAYWLISIPLGYTLGLKYNLKLVGFWIGLLVAAVFLCLIMIYKLRKHFVTKF